MYTLVLGQLVNRNTEPNVASTILRTMVGIIGFIHMYCTRFVTLFFNLKWQNDVFVTSYLIGDGKFLLWLLTILANLNELYKQPLLGYLYGRIGSTCELF